jgi:hypothetical protein
VSLDDLRQLFSTLSISEWRMQREEGPSEALGGTRGGPPADQEHQEHHPNEAVLECCLQYGIAKGAHTQTVDIHGHAANACREHRKHVPDGPIALARRLRGAKAHKQAAARQSGGAQDLVRSQAKE